jgi:hypothetical protein
MANLLDNPNDVGMLSLGLRLLSTPGKFGQALGTSGLGAMGDMQQAKQAQALAQQQAMQQEMQRMQLENIKRQQAQAAADQARKAKDDSILQETFTQMPGPMPDGSAGVDPRFHLPTMISKGLSMDSVPEALKLQSVLNPARKLTAYKPGDQVRDEAGNVVFSVPDKAADDKEVARLKLIYGDGTPAYFSALSKLGDKMTTHAPAATAISYGSPVPIMLPDGSTGYAQPGNRPGAPPQMMNDPTTGKPLMKPADKPPVEFNKSVTGLKELSNGLDAYAQTLKKQGGIGPMATGEKRAALQGSYTSLQMGLKNAFELGALAGPDLELLQGMLVDPTSVMALKYGDKGVEQQIAKAREYLKNRGRAVYEGHSRPVPPEYAATPAAGPFNDAGKEARYQAWKAQQGAKQ